MSTPERAQPEEAPSAAPVRCPHGIVAPLSAPDRRVLHCACCKQPCPLRLHATSFRQISCEDCCGYPECTLHGSVR